MKYTGWVLMADDPGWRKPRVVRRMPSEEAARELSRALNHSAARDGRRTLYWPEEFSTTSVVDTETSEEGGAR